MSLNDLLSTFTTQLQGAMDDNSPAPWQQELLEEVNPEKQRRRALARALQQASTALATTPGNFLQGLAAASGQGADAYITQRDEDREARIRAQQLIEQENRQRRDRTLNLLMDGIGVTERMDDRTYRRGRDEASDKRQERIDRENADYRKASLEARRTGRGSYSSDAAARTARTAAAREYSDWLKDFREQNSRDPEADEAEREWSDILYRFGLENDRDPNVSQFDLMSDPNGGALEVEVPEDDGGIIPGNREQPATAAPAPQSILKAPPPMQSRVVGQVYQTPKGPMIWTGQGWKPAQ